MLYKINDILKCKVAPYFWDLKRLFKISFIYSIFVYILDFIFMKNVMMLTRISLSFLPVLAFYLVWGISTVIMMGDFVERPDPVVKSKYFLKPGRYIVTRCGPFTRYKEMRNSPVDDHTAMLILMDFIFVPLTIISSITQKDPKGLLFINIIVAINFGVLREVNRLEKDYALNMKKAKIIFFENNGDMNVLKEHGEYQRYQVSLEYEEKWKKELNESEERE